MWSPFGHRSDTYKSLKQEIFLTTISHHIVRNSGRRTEHRGAPSPATHSTVQARHPALNLHSRAPEQAAGGKAKAYASVETVPKEPMTI